MAHKSLTIREPFRLCAKEFKEYKEYEEFKEPNI